MNPGEIYQQALAAGFSGESAVIATAIALAESGGNAGVTSRPNNNGTVDRGLWQINSVHKEYDPAQLVNDPGYNARAAFALSGGGRVFKPWSTFNSGAYKNYLNTAREAAAGNVGVSPGGPAGGPAGAALPAKPQQSPAEMIQQASNIAASDQVSSLPTDAKGPGEAANIAAQGSSPSVTDAAANIANQETPKPAPQPAQPAQQDWRAVAPAGGEIQGPAGTAIKAAMGALGVPYVWGGNSLQKGVDCSGLIQQAYAAAGIKIPRVSNDQINAGTPIDPSQMAPGDILGWAYNNSLGGGATHVAMYIGGGKMVEALHRGTPVHIVDVRPPQFVTRITRSAPRSASVTPLKLQPDNNPNSSFEARLAAIANAFSYSMSQGVTKGTPTGGSKVM